MRACKLRLITEGGIQHTTIVRQRRTFTPEFKPAISEAL